MTASDATAKELLDKFKIQMPNQNLSPPEIQQYAAYFKWADEHLQPQGKPQPQPQPSAPGTALPPSETKSATPVKE